MALVCVGLKSNQLNNASVPAEMEIFQPIRLKNALLTPMHSSGADAAFLATDTFSSNLSTLPQQHTRLSVSASTLSMGNNRDITVPCSDCTSNIFGWGCLGPSLSSPANHFYNTRPTVVAGSLGICRNQYQQSPVSELDDLFKVHSQQSVVNTEFNHGVTQLRLNLPSAPN